MSDSKIPKSTLISMALIVAFSFAAIVFGETVCEYDLHDTSQDATDCQIQLMIEEDV